MTGEEYSTSKTLSGFNVNGGFFCETLHNTLIGAQREKALRDSINHKFPFVVPRKQREINKAKRLRLIT